MNRELPGPANSCSVRLKEGKVLINSQSRSIVNDMVSWNHDPVANTIFDPVLSRQDGKYYVVLLDWTQQKLTGLNVQAIC